MLCEREDGNDNGACWSVVAGDMEIVLGGRKKKNSPSQLSHLDMFSYHEDWEGFSFMQVLNRGRGLCTYLSTLRQGQGITETSAVFPWFPAQLCLPPAPNDTCLLALGITPR